VSSPRVLAAALAAVRCPVCAGRLARRGLQLRCERGHCFDIARQGYVNLAGGGRPAANADASAMVAARARFLDRGHYAPIAAALTSLAVSDGSGSAGSGVVLDLAGGTGYYLAALLEALPGSVGVCLDLSKPALRRAASAHPRSVALGADVWQPFPLADGSAAIVMSVFGPRNAGETMRVLTRGGIFLLVTPTASHLAEVIGPLRMLSVDAAKADRLAARMTGLDRVAAEPLSYQAALTHADLGDLVSMGPSAHHIDPDQLASRIEPLPEPLWVTVSVMVSTYRRAE
jgi:23S rRNA (guanine745-N1)-methyltransferase